MKGNPWTKEEIEFVKANYQNMTDKELAEHIDRTPTAINAYRQRKGIVNNNRYWKEDEVEDLKKYYSDTPKDDLLEMFPNKDIGQIYNKAHSLGLKKDELLVQEQNKKLGKQLAESEASKATRFEKGHEPMNKGMSQEEFMSPEAIERTKATRFKKGNKPHTTKWDGAITIRHPHKGRGAKPEVWIRISEGEWEKYSRYQYEKHIGPIPDGMLVALKDGNPFNCYPENLELITRAENARRNSNPEKAAEALRKYQQEHGNPAKQITDNYVAAMIAGGDKELRDFIVEERQDLIKVARANYKLKRQINNEHD